MKKQLSFLLSLILLLSVVVISNTAYAGTLGTRKLGIVTQVIDGEAVAVQFGDMNVRIKLIGVNTNASEKTLEYVTSVVMGKYVWVIVENLYNTNYTSSSYYPAYVYLYDTGEMLNTMILNEGLGELNTTYSAAAKYSELVNAQTYGKSKRVGIWQDSSSSSRYTYSNDGVNINTATSSQLRALSSRITSSIASNIINYRKYNPFNTIEEIKFVSGITKEIYDDIYNEITVVTNINDATEDELLTLAGLTEEDVDSLLDYRDDHKFTSLTQFYTKTDVSSTKYNNNKHFISLDDEDYIDYVVEDKVVNINTASSSQISSAGGTYISSSTADKIVSYRKNGYTYKTLMELCEISSSSITQSTIDKVEDNFHLYTDINNATIYELQSLFGSSYVSSEINKIDDERPFRSISQLKDIIGATKYDKIKQYIYVDDYTEPNRININLASLTQLQKLTLSSSDASKLKNKYKEMDDAGDLPFNVEGINNTIVLYTNINTATEHELESLYNMKASIVSDIITYRNDQPFGSMDEVEEFFEDHNEKSFYNSIKEFIVVR